MRLGGELLDRFARRSGERVRVTQRLSEHRLGLFARRREDRLGLLAGGGNDLVGFRLRVRDVFVRGNHGAAEGTLERSTPERTGSRGVGDRLQSTELTVELVDPRPEVGDGLHNGVAPGDRGPHLVERLRHDDENNPWSRALRMLIIVVATMLAFNQTLRASFRVLGVDSPLAYTGLVPAIALLVACTRPPRRAGTTVQPA